MPWQFRAAGAGQRCVRPCRLPGEFGTEPVGRDECCGAAFIGKLHLSGAKPGQVTSVKVDFGHVCTEGQSRALLVDSPTIGVHPQRFGVLSGDDGLYLGATQALSCLHGESGFNGGDAHPRLDGALLGQVSLTDWDPGGQVGGNALTVDQKLSFDFHSHPGSLTHRGSRVDKTMPTTTTFVAKSPDLAGLLAALEHADFEVGIAERSSFQWHDTFDGRLHAARLQLVLTRGRDPSLILASAQSAPASVVLSTAPKFVDGLPAGPFRSRLAAVVEMRALRPTVGCTAEVTEVWRRDGSDKIVSSVRVLFDIRTASGAPFAATVVEVDELSGHPGAAKRTRQLMAASGWAESESTLVELVAGAGGYDLAGFRDSPTVPLNAADRAVDGFAAVLQNLAASMTANLPGTIADVDTEFLHDLRVAIRRTRAILSRAKRVLPDDARQKFQLAFADFGGHTSEVRDLDVYLLGWDRDIASLSPTTRSALDPIRALLVQRRARAQQELRQVLTSAATSQMLNSWSACLAEPGRAEAAERPLGAFVAEQITKVERRLVTDGRAITDESPAAEVHQLRKDAKRLRYMVECFGGLPGDVPRKAFVGQLKALQNNLGVHQDADVQAEWLRNVVLTEPSVRGHDELLVAVGQLIELMEQRQRDARREFADRFRRFDSDVTRRHLRELLRGWST
jgi:CHAD domain-containing protein